MQRGETMNNRGKGSSLTLIFILIVALLNALLAVKQFSSLNTSDTAQPEAQQEPVQQAQDAVNALNERMGQYDEGN